jgi:hypothetical protein
MGGTMGYPHVTEIATAKHFQLESENSPAILELNAPRATRRLYSTRLRYLAYSPHIGSG